MKQKKLAQRQQTPEHPCTTRVPWAEQSRALPGIDIHVRKVVHIGRRNDNLLAGNTRGAFTVARALTSKTGGGPAGAAPIAAWTHRCTPAGLRGRASRQGSGQHCRRLQARSAGTCAQQQSRRPSPLAALTDQQAAGRATAARTRSRVVPVPALPRLEPQTHALVSTLAWCSPPLCFRYLPAPYCACRRWLTAHSEHMQLCTRSRQLRHCENTRLTNDRFSIAVVVGAVQGVNAGIYKDADVLNSQSAGRPITYRFSPGSMPLCPISGMHLSR